MKSAATKAASAAYTKQLRDQRRAVGVCINNPAHGPAARGGRCEPCALANSGGSGRDCGHRAWWFARVRPVSVVAVAGLPVPSSSWSVE